MAERVLMSFLPRPDQGPRREGHQPDPEHPEAAVEHDDTRTSYRSRGGAADSSSSDLTRPLGLTALGTLVPGAGLSLTTRRRLGLALLLVTVATLIGLGWYVVVHGAQGSALDLAARPRLLQFIAVGMSIAALVWIASIVLTAATTRPRPMTRGQRSLLVAFTGAMCLLVAAPTGLGLRYIDAHVDAVGKIFLGKSSTFDPDRPQATPNIEEDDPWADTPRVNVLLLGSDAGDNREGVRTDSMMVASIDAQTGDTVLFGIPRNLEQVPIPAQSPLSNAWPNGYNCGDACLMNGIWSEAEAQAEANPGWFAGDPTPGRTATEDVIGAVLGQPIHNTIIVNLAGFKDMIDAMGGVRIDVQERLPLGGETVTNAQGGSSLVPGTENGWLEVGPQELNGYQALWYARSRVTSDDFARMRRQRCVVGAVIDQVNPMTMVQRYPQIVGVAGENVTSDIAADQLPAWADLVERVQNGTISSLPITPENTDVIDPDYDALHRKVEEAINPPAPVDDRTATATPSETTAEPTSPDRAPSPATPEEPTDELEEIGAVC